MDPRDDPVVLLEMILGHQIATDGLSTNQDSYLDQYNWKIGTKIRGIKAVSKLFSHFSLSSRSNTFSSNAMKYHIDQLLTFEIVSHWNLALCILCFLSMDYVFYNLMIYNTQSRRRMIAYDNVFVKKNIFHHTLGKISAQPYTLIMHTNFGWTIWTVYVKLHENAACIINVWGCAEILPYFVLLTRTRYRNTRQTLYMQIVQHSLLTV